jgi:hypothetical protein
MQRWRTFPPLAGSYLGEMARQLQLLENTQPQHIPDFSNSKSLYCFSDYGGDIKSNKYNTYSFLLTDDKSIAYFSVEHKKIRHYHGIGKRKFSYKDLSDKVLTSPCDDFIRLSDHINGILLSVAISKKINISFTYNNQNEDFSFLNKQKSGNIQRILTISHLASVFIASIVRKMQNIIWITDNDNIVANDEFTALLTRIAASIISTLIDFNLGHFRCGSSRCDNGDNLIEDLLSIPDFAAGILANQLDIQLFDGHVFWMHRGDAKDKQNKLSWWLADSTSFLRKYIFIFDSDDSPEKVKTSFFHFYDHSES